MRKIFQITAAVSILIGTGFIVMQMYPDALRAALFEVNTGVSTPVNGVYINRGYESQPNERGSVVLQAAEMLEGFEGMEFTFVADPARASILRVGKTAVTQNFDLSVNFPAEGVVHVALVGSPRQIADGGQILEFELQIVDNSMNVLGGRIDLRLLDARYLVDGDRIMTASHDGLITITNNQNAVALPHTPHIKDVDPGIYPMVRDKNLIVRGKAFPSNPNVLLGNRPVQIISSSSTEIIASIPEDTLPGVYAVSVDSLLSPERVVVYESPSSGESVDILEEMMFISPNPVLYNSEIQGGEMVLWIPVFNPLGADDPIVGSVDLSSIGGNPNTAFNGIGNPAVGPGGTRVNWFRIPSSGTFALPETMDTNVDYPITVRVENRSLTSDAAVETLKLRSNVSQGGTPAFGSIESIPSSVVPGDTVSFFADVTDADGVGTLDIVSIRLTSLGGSVSKMEPVLSVASSTNMITATFSVDYVLEETLEPGNYQLELQAIDEDGNSSDSTFTFIVNESGGQDSGAPSILQSFAVPSQVPADDKTKASFTVEVEDADGVDDIVASINLAPINLGVIEMKLDSGTKTKESTRGYFVADKLKIPTSVRSGTYNLQVNVEDSRGNRTADNISFLVGPGGAGVGDAPTVRESRFIPETSRPGGDVRLFVEVEDLNGTDDIVVVADFTELRLEVEELDELINFTSGTVMTQNTYSSNTLKIPEDLPQGVYDVKIQVFDESGNSEEIISRLRIERGGADEGQAPRINVGKSFQSPRVFANDDSSSGELHVLVDDPDDDVLTVITKIGTIGRASSASVRESAGEIELMCGRSSIIVCMDKGVPEGPTGRWFTLDGISIPPTTIATSDAYFVEITAIDEQGHTDTSIVPVMIGDDETDETLRVSPEILLVVPVNEREMEVVVSSPIDTATVDRGGAQFTIQPTLDAFTKLNVQRVSWDTSARFLYLQTDVLSGGRTYTFGVDSDTENLIPLMNVYGTRFARDQGGSITFAGYEPTGKAPEIEKVTVLDAEHLNVRFETQVLPSSVHPHLLPANASLVSTVTGDIVRIKGGELQTGARNLHLEVEEIREGDRYILTIPGVLAPGLISVPDPGAQKTFIANFPSDHGSSDTAIFPTPDLNRDGRVDFADFTLFSAVYDTEYDFDDVQVLLEDTHDSAPEKESDDNVGGDLPKIKF